MRINKEWHEVALIVLFLIFFEVNLLDYVSTIVGISHGASETNWFAILLMGDIGIIPALMRIKALFSILIGGTIWFLVKDTPKTFIDDDFLIGGLTILNVIGFFVHSNNFAVLGLLTDLRLLRRAIR